MSRCRHRPEDIIQRAVCQHLQMRAFELKPPGGRLSTAQLETHAAMRAAGATVTIAYGVDDALKQARGARIIARAGERVVP